MFVKQIDWDGIHPNFWYELIKVYSPKLQLGYQYRPDVRCTLVHCTHNYMRQCQASKEQLCKQITEVFQQIGVLGYEKHEEVSTPMKCKCCGQEIAVERGDYFLYEGHYPGPYMFTYLGDDRWTLIDIVTGDRRFDPIYGKKEAIGKINGDVAVKKITRKEAAEYLLNHV